MEAAPSTLIGWLDSNQPAVEWLGAIATAMAVVIALYEVMRTSAREAKQQLTFILAVMVPIQVSRDFALMFLNELEGNTRPHIRMAYDQGEWGFDVHDRMLEQLRQFDVARMPSPRAMGAVHEARAAIEHILAARVLAGGTESARELALNRYRHSAGRLTAALIDLELEARPFDEGISGRLRRAWNWLCRPI